MGLQRLLGGGGAGSVAPSIGGAIGTSLTAAQNMALSATQETWLTGTLNANLTVTLTAYPAGARGKLIVAQDAIGSRTLTVTAASNSTVIPIPATAQQVSEVLIESLDGTAANVTCTLLANPDATTSQKGAVLLSAAPALATQPIVMAQNDPNLSNVAILTSNLTAISAQTTLQNATGLSFNIGASATEVWFVEAWILLTAANATMDVKFALTGPTAATGQGGLIGGSAGGWATPGTSGTPSNSVGLGTAVAVGTPTSGESGYPLAWTVFGGGTSGACQLQYAQNTSDAGNLQILAGSFLRYRRLHS